MPVSSRGSPVVKETVVGESAAWVLGGKEVLCLSSGERPGLDTEATELRVEAMYRCLLGLLPCFLRGLPLDTGSACSSVSERPGVPTALVAQVVGPRELAPRPAVFTSGTWVGGVETASVGADVVCGVCLWRCRNLWGRNRLLPWGLFREGCVVRADGEVSCGAGVVTSVVVVSLPNTTPSVDSPGRFKSVTLFTASRVKSSRVVGSTACPFPSTCRESMGCVPSIPSSCSV